MLLPIVQVMGVWEDSIKPLDILLFHTKEITRPLEQTFSGEEPYKV